MPNPRDCLWTVHFKPAVHTLQEGFELSENAALFLRLRILSTLIRYQNRVFGKRYSNQRNLKATVSRLSVFLYFFDNVIFPA